MSICKPFAVMACLGLMAPAAGLAETRTLLFADGVRHGHEYTLSWVDGGRCVTAQMQGDPDKQYSVRFKLDCREPDYRARYGAGVNYTIFTGPLNGWSVLWADYEVVSSSAGAEVFVHRMPRTGDVEPKVVVELSAPAMGWITVDVKVLLIVQDPLR